ncbi:MAG: YfhO family protein [Candidatus Eremiobacteraeota bacterium]|nr:YfhO family protein [Candidatus Eremiobacteraeota bacterium]MCW5869105.1 YfhO family protein [Candidatus Eremiobacteraeota bacterium]
MPTRYRKPACCALCLAGVLLVLFAPFLLWPGSILFSPHSDFIAYHSAIRAVTAESVQRFGELPRWCPYLFCGFPLAGLGETQAFYPPTWAYFLAAPQAGLRVYGLLVLGHLWIGGLGMAAYLRIQRYSWSACLLGALIFMLQGKWLAFLLLAQNSMLGWAWFPWVLAGMHRLQQRLTLARVLELAGLIALLVLGLLAPLIVIAAYFLVCYGGYQVLKERSWKLALALLTACILAAGLCAALLLPGLEYSSFAMRGQGLSLEQASQGQISLPLLPHLLSGAYPPLRIGWELCLFCGTVPWCLALLSLRYGHSRWAWLGVGLILALALGRQTPIFGLVYQVVPGFGFFRFPARYCLLLGLLLPGLAARAFERSHDWNRAELLALWLATAGLAAWGQWLSGGKEAWWGVFWLSGLVICPRRWRQRTVILLCGLELFHFASQMIEARPGQFLGEQSLTALVKDPPGQGRTLVSYSQMLIPPYAVRDGVETSNGLTASVPKATFFLMQQAVGELPRQPQMSEGIPFFEPRSAAYLRRANLTHVLSDHPLNLGANWSMRRSPPFTTYDFIAPTGFSNFPPLWIYDDQSPLGRHRLVGLALAAKDSQSALELARRTEPEQAVVIEGATPRPATAQPEAVVISEQRSYDQRRLICRVSQAPGAYLVVSELYYPGWKLTEQGQELPLQRADGYFMAAFLNPGDHELLLEYQPKRYRQGIWISLLSLLGLGLAYGGDRVLGARRRLATDSQR